MAYDQQATRMGVPMWTNEKRARYDRCAFRYPRASGQLEALRSRRGSPYRRTHWPICGATWTACALLSSNQGDREDPRQASCESPDERRHVAARGSPEWSASGSRLPTCSSRGSLCVKFGTGGLWRATPSSLELQTRRGESGKKLGVRRLGDARCRWSNSGEPIAADRNGARGPR
jgi:hypothetical protein